MNISISLIPIWHRKAFIVLLGLVCGLLSWLYVGTINSTYAATVLLAPANKSGNGLSNALAQYGGLASIAGVQIASPTDYDSQLGLEVMKSRSFIVTFLKKRELVKPLLATSGWDGDTNLPILDASILDLESEEWTSVYVSKHGEPSESLIYTRFLESLTISNDVATGFVNIELRHYSPEFARSTLIYLISDLNRHMKEAEIKEGRELIAYLEDQISSTPFAELRQVFSSLLQAQHEKVMLAEVKQEFVFRTIDPAFSTYEPVGPPRSLLVLFSFIAGLILGATVVVFREGIVELSD